MPGGAYHEAAYLGGVRAGDVTIVHEGSGSGEPERLETQDNRMNSLSKVPKPTRPNAPSPPLAIPLDLPFMIVNRSVCARRGVERLRRQLARGSCAQHQVAKRRASTNPAHLPLPLVQAMSEARDIELLFAIWEQNVEKPCAL